MRLSLRVAKLEAVIREIADGFVPDRDGAENANSKLYRALMAEFPQPPQSDGEVNGQ